MSARHSAIAFLMMLAFACTSSVAAEPKEESATLELIESKLDAIIRRIESLEKRISHLEASKVTQIEPEILGTVGPYRIDKSGFLYGENRMQMGIWGVEEPLSRNSQFRSRETESPPGRQLRSMPR